MQLASFRKTVEPVHAPQEHGRRQRCRLCQLRSSLCKNETRLECRRAPLKRDRLFGPREDRGCARSLVIQFYNVAKKKKASQGVLHSCTSENLWCAEMERSRSEVGLACLHDLQLVPDSGREVHSESRGCPNSKAARGKKCRPEGAHCVMCEADLLRRQTIGYGFECLRMGLAAGFGTPGLPVRAENELRDPLPVRIVAGALSAYSRL